MRNISTYHQKILNGEPFVPDEGYVKLYFRDDAFYYMLSDGIERELLTFDGDITFEGDTTFQKVITMPIDPSEITEDGHLVNVAFLENKVQEIMTQTQSELELRSLISDIQDNLTSTDTDKPLSANQGKVLKEHIDSINTLLSSDDTTLDELQEIVDYIKVNNEELQNLSTGAIAGLEDRLQGLQDQITSDVENLDENYYNKEEVDQLTEEYERYTYSENISAGDHVILTDSKEVAKYLKGFEDYRKANGLEKTKAYKVFQIDDENYGVIYGDLNILKVDKFKINDIGIYDLETIIIDDNIGIGPVLDNDGGDYIEGTNERAYSSIANVHKITDGEFIILYNSIGTGDKEGSLPLSIKYIDFNNGTLSNRYESESESEYFMMSGVYFYSINILEINGDIYIYTGYYGLGKIEISNKEVTGITDIMLSENYIKGLINFGNGDHKIIYFSEETNVPSMMITNISFEDSSIDESNILVLKETSGNDEFQHMSYLYSNILCSNIDNLLFYSLPIFDGEKLYYNKIEIRDNNNSLNLIKEITIDGNIKNIENYGDNKVIVCFEKDGILKYSIIDNSLEVIETQDFLGIETLQTKEQMPHHIPNGNVINTPYGNLGVVGNDNTITYGVKKEANGKFLGIAQETGTTGDTKPVATYGDISRVHTGLTAGEDLGYGRVIGDTEILLYKNDSYNRRETNTIISDLETSLNLEIYNSKVCNLKDMTEEEIDAATIDDLFLVNCTLGKKVKLRDVFHMLQDTDSDGIPNTEDIDDDGDGYTDEEEREATTSPVDPHDYPSFVKEPFIMTINDTGEKQRIRCQSGTILKVDWGDGTVNTKTEHIYANPGEYDIKITGEDLHLMVGYSATDIKQWGEVKWGSMASMFYNTDISTWTATDAPDLSNVTDMSYMFKGATSFNQDISSWDVSNVEDMSNMFNDAKKFNQPLNNWDTSNVTNMRGMFDNAKIFNQPLNNWNTSNVTNISSMFSGASTFNQDISSWDTSSVTNMNEAFSSAYSFNQSLNSWDVSNVEDMFGMFDYAEKFNQPLNNWDTSNVTNMRGMFHYTKLFNQDISSWDVSNVTDMRSMFTGATSFNQPLNTWDVSNVTNMLYMFSGATSFNQPLNTWDVSNVTNYTEFATGTPIENEPTKLPTFTN